MIVVGSSSHRVPLPARQPDCLPAHARSGRVQHGDDRHVVTRAAHQRVLQQQVGHPVDLLVPVSDSTMSSSFSALISPSLHSMKHISRLELAMHLFEEQRLLRAHRVGDGASLGKRVVGGHAFQLAGAQPVAAAVARPQQAVMPAIGEHHHHGGGDDGAVGNGVAARVAQRLVGCRSASRAMSSTAPPKLSGARNWSR